MKTAEQHAKPASMANTRGLTVLAGLLGCSGSGFVSLRRCGPFALTAIAVLVMGVSCAFAAPPVSFGEPGEGAGQIAATPDGIAIDQESGNVFVHDDENGRADKFGPEGEFLVSFGWGVVNGAAELQVCGPEAIVPTLTCRKGIVGIVNPGPGQFDLTVAGAAVDNSGVIGQQGDIYVPNSSYSENPVFSKSSGSVTKFGPRGEFLLMIGGGVDRGPHHPGNLCTAAFIAEGDSCGGAINGTGTGPGEFKTISLAVGPTGTLYVGDKERVQKFSSTGAFEGQISLPGVDAHTIAVDSVGDIYVASENLNGVHKYDSTGVELGEPRDLAFHSVATLLAIGPADELFVLGAVSVTTVNHIDVFDSSGKQVSTFLNEVQGSGTIKSSGLAYGDKIGRLYNLDSQNSRVDLISPPAPGPLLLPNTTAAKEIHKTDAVLCAEVNPEGKPTTVHFDYLAEAKYKQDGEAFGAGTEETTESASIGEDFEFHKACQQASGLSAATAYRFRVVASNENGPAGGVLGEVAGFETEPPFLIDATFATGVSATSVILDTEINPLGEAVTYHFEYDTTPYLEGEGPHGTAVPVSDASAGASEGDVLRAAPLYGLAPETTYYYRVVAHSPLATIIGSGSSFTTQSAVSGPPSLDGRVWERVSPAQKGGSLIRGMYGEDPEGVLQASADGSGLAFTSVGSFGQEAPGNRSFLESQFLASRGVDGWSTKDVTPRREDVVGAVPGNTEGYEAFSEDLSLGMLQPRGVTPLSPLATETTPYLRVANGEYLPLVDPSDVPPETVFDGKIGSDGKVSNEPELEGASPDLHSVVISSCFKLTEDAVNSCTKGGKNLYVWHEGALQLASILPSNHPASGEIELGEVVGNAFQKRHAVAEDGNRLVFNVNGKHLYLRDMKLGKTVQLDVPEAGVPSGSEAPLVEDMSADGSKVFFRDVGPLTKNSGNFDLYMCEIIVQGENLVCALKDLSVARNTGEAGAVLGESIGMDSTGRYVYFAANGALTPDSPPGDCKEDAGTGTCGLYLYDTVTGSVKLVATLSGADYVDWGGNSGGLPGLAARVSANGRFVAFVSRHSLTGYDNRDAVSGKPDVEVYLYDRLGDSGDGKLVCASCNPTGARPHGVEIVDNHTLLSEDQVWHSGTWVAGAIPGWTSYKGGTAFYQSRYLSDSGRLFFDSADALVPRDSNGTVDVYEYEPPQGEDQPASNDCIAASPTYSPLSGGCVDLISSGTSPLESEFLDASESGDDVFFLTGSQLVPADADTSLDVYDARVDGTVSETVKPPACEGDACQNPVSPPEDPTPGSLTFHGPGNPAPVVSVAVKGKARPATRSEKLAGALRACARKSKRKRAACERQARRSYGPVGKAKKVNRGAHR